MNNNDLNEGTELQRADACGGGLKGSRADSDGNGRFAKQPGSEVPPAAKGRRATAPQTGAGKTRSSRNALTHGIFSDAGLYKEEQSRKKYANLHKGLRAHFEPVGPFEELLVDKVAMTIWRLRRLLTAEAGRVLPYEEFNEIAESWSLPLDLLIKYGASLERTFDRTLAQLERAQALRKGLPLAPRLEVDVHHSVT